MYNGGVALQQGKEQISQNYIDNYWDILPVERMDIDEKILLPDSVRNQNFGRAEEKAVKAIQKHSMQIDGKERNPQMDEAYLLLGKSRYFDQRFVPALDAFNYILYRYPASDNINHAKVWRAKTNIRLENDRLAINNLKKLLESDRLEDQDIADANAALAQAYINLNVLDSAEVSLGIASEFTGNRDEEGRYLFIQGQLLNRLGNTTEANQVFDRIIELHRKIPRIYYVNAYVQKARNFEYNQGNNVYLLSLLQELEENRENRPYLDRIYFQLGEYYMQTDSTDAAVDYYNRSLRSESSDLYLKSVTYEILANVNFDRANYQRAGKYYDSTLAYMSPELLEFRTIKKKRANLEDVIRYEKLAEETDSIIRIAGMTEEERLQYFTNYTDSLRAIAMDNMAADSLPVYSANIGPDNPFPSSTAIPPSQEVSGNTFYFYNPLVVSRGAQEFLRNWGSRELQDNWRWGSNATNQSSINAQQRIMDVNIENDPIYDPATYIAKMPADEFILDSLATQRNLAYYQLGLAYFENYGEYPLAQNRLEALLEYQPEDRLVLPTKYNLYKLYDLSGQVDKRNRIRTDILTNYPDSRYAAFIQNPDQAQLGENEVNARYNELYRKFENSEYFAVLEGVDEFSKEYAGDPMIPKFELLGARATARLYGIDQYEVALNRIATSYPQTKIGVDAQKLVANVQDLRNLELESDSLHQNFKLVYEFASEEDQPAEQLIKTIKEALSDLKYDDYSVSMDVYDPETLLVVVHNFNSKMRALGFAELLQNNKNYRVQKDNFVISSENYRIVQIKKILRNYLNEL